MTQRKAPPKTGASKAPPTPRAKAVPKGAVASRPKASSGSKAPSKPKGRSKPKATAKPKAARTAPAPVKATTPPKPEATPEEILKPCTPVVRRIAEEVRSLMRHVVPTSTEKAYPGWHGIGFRDPQAGYVVGLFPHADHVRLFFERGAELDDPDRVFAPADGLKQGRFVELRTVIDAKKPALRRMIIRAVVNQSV